MAEFIISAFSDEAGNTLEEQIFALTDNGIAFMEPRSFNGKGILSLTNDQLIEIKMALDDKGIKVSSLGSPIGKYSITEPFEQHLKELYRAIEICHILETSNMRVFSFFIPEGEPAKKYSDEVLSRMRKLSEIAKENGITLNHENEKEIFGQNPEEVNFLAENIKDIKFIFDGANYIMSGCDVADGMEATLKNFGYFHIKDAISESQTIVPVGEGEARYANMINTVDKLISGRVYMTLEPHLHEFDAFKSIDKTELHSKYNFSNNRESFDFAVKALKKLLTEEGYKEIGGVWKK